MPKHKVTLQHPQTRNGEQWGGRGSALAVYREESALQQKNMRCFPGSSPAGKGLVARLDERAACYKHKSFMWKCDFKSRAFNYTSQMKKRSHLLGIYWWVTE